MDNIKEYNFADIGGRIRQERIDSKLSLAQVEEHTGISRQTLSKWEKNFGNGNPTITDMLKLCNLFDCDLSYLLCEHDERHRIETDICKATGLSVPAVDLLGKWQQEKPEYVKLLNAMISCDDFPFILEQLTKAREYETMDRDSELCKDLLRHGTDKNDFAQMHRERAIRRLSYLLDDIGMEEGDR